MTNASLKYNQTVKLAKNTAAVRQNQLVLQPITTNGQIVLLEIKLFIGMGVKFANMVRPYGTNAATVRHIIYTERDSALGTYTHTDVFGGQAGWPDIDVERMGPNAGQIGVVGHSPDKLGLWDGSAFQLTHFCSCQ